MTDGNFYDGQCMEDATIFQAILCLILHGRAKFGLYMMIVLIPLSDSVAE